MFGTLGGPELFLIFVVALIVFGPRKLPDIGKSLGRMMSEFRRASNEFKSTIESEVESEKIRDSMKLEAPKITKSKAPSPGTAAQTAAAATGAADGSGTGGGGASTPSPSEPAPGSAAPEPLPKNAGTTGAPEPSEGAQTGADAEPPASGPADTPEPTTVSRQPPAPDSK